MSNIELRPTPPTTELPKLPPKHADDAETRWDDPWGAAREAREEIETARGAFLNDLSMATRITSEIERDPHAVARLRKARTDAREGRRMPRPTDTSSS